MMKQLKYIILGILLSCACVFGACVLSKSPSPSIPPQDIEDGTGNGGNEGGLGDSENENESNGSNGGGEQGSGNQGEPDDSNGGSGNEDEYAPNF